MVMVCHGSHSWLWMGRHCWDERNVKKCARFPTEIAWTPQQSTSHRCVCHAFQANLHWCVLLVGNFQDVRLKFPNCLALQAVQVAFANEKWLRYDFGWWACHHNDCHFWIVFFLQIPLTTGTAPRARRFFVCHPYMVMGNEVPQHQEEPDFQDYVWNVVNATYIHLVNHGWQKSLMA